MTLINIGMVMLLLYADGTVNNTPQGNMWVQQEITDEELMEFFSIDDIVAMPQKRWAMALVPDMVYCAIVPTGHENGTQGFIVEIVKIGDDPKYPIVRQIVSGSMTNWKTDARMHDSGMETWKKQCLHFVGELPDPDIKHQVLTYFNNYTNHTKRNKQ